jgi:circadian clock protein KaiC
MQIPNRVSSGVYGLDDVLKGGFIQGYPYLIKGGPGSGKTLFGLHFLAEGVRNGEKVVYISFDESVNEIKRQGRDFDIPVDKIDFVDMLSSFGILTKDQIYLWTSSSLSEIFDFIKAIEEVAGDAKRAFIDGIGVLSDVIRDGALYRRIISTIVRRLSSNGVTTLLSAEAYEDPGRSMISYVVSGEIILEVRERDGRVLRLLKLLKFRGDAYIGTHYFDIKQGKIQVYPIIEFPIQRNWKKEIVSTGNLELDRMFGGGILRGSHIIVSGKNGVGKTNICLQLLMENDKRGETGVFYSFDESEDIIFERFKKIFNYEPKNLVFREFENISSIGEFYANAVEDLRNLNPSIVVVDPANVLEYYSVSKNEIVGAMTKLENLMKQSGGIMVSVLEITEAMDVFHFTGYGVSQFSDYLLSGRHIELDGELLKAIAVVKNRFGDHERSFRILEIKDGEGLKIGEPLREFAGIISGHFQKVS